MAVTSSCKNSRVWHLPIGGGIIESNQIGAVYSDNMDCHWSLSSSARLELVFLRFNTEPSYDVVHVYNGESSSSPVIGRFSGSSLPSPVTSSSSKLFVRFTSDGSHTYQGFRARFRGTMHFYWMFQEHSSMKACISGHISKRVTNYFQMWVNDFAYSAFRLSFVNEN